LSEAELALLVLASQAVPAAQGAFAVDILCQVDGVPIAGFEVWITTGVDGSQLVQGTFVSDTFGIASGFFLDPGIYYVWRMHSGYNISNPMRLTVAAMARQPWRR
jgi:hypothetical protein